MQKDLLYARRRQHVQVSEALGTRLSLHVCGELPLTIPSGVRPTAVEVPSAERARSCRAHRPLKPASMESIASRCAVFRTFICARPGDILNAVPRTLSSLAAILLNDVSNDVTSG
jgi:hypothetical protein